MKSIVGVVGAVLAVLYCGRLLFYFYDVSGSIEDAQKVGLGPTMMGLGAIGLLFVIILVVKVARMIRGPRSPGSGRRGSPNAPTQDDDGGFDADAAIARYVALRSTDAAAAVPAASVGSGAANPPSFGRRVT
jgi:hypothetical protein